MSNNNKSTENGIYMTSDGNKADLQHTNLQTTQNGSSGELCNTLPPPLDTGDIMDEARAYMLDLSVDYPEPYYLLEYNGVPFSPLGGIQAISGQKKNGKSFVLTQLMAAVLGQDSGRVKEYLDGLRVPQRTIDHLGHLPKVLYIDTEMEELNSAKVMRSVHWLCDWDINQRNERFSVLALGEEPDHAKRLRVIREGIECIKPDIVFINGIRNIIGDYNDNEESAALVQKLMALAQKRDICIWCALHLNPRPKNDDESKMRGHLGTELGNKVTDTLICIKTKSQSGVTFTVKQQDARGKDMEDWRFEIVDDAGQLGIPKIFVQVKSIKLKRLAGHEKKKKKHRKRHLYAFWPRGAKRTAHQSADHAERQQRRIMPDLAATSRHR